MNPVLASKNLTQFNLIRVLQKITDYFAFNTNDGLLNNYPFWQTLNEIINRQLATLHHQFPSSNIYYTQ